MRTQKRFGKVELLDMVPFSYVHDGKKLEKKVRHLLGLLEGEASRRETEGCLGVGVQCPKEVIGMKGVFGYVTQIIGERIHRPGRKGMESASAAKGEPAGAERLSVNVGCFASSSPQGPPAAMKIR